MVHTHTTPQSTHKGTAVNFANTRIKYFTFSSTSLMQCAPVYLFFHSAKTVYTCLPFVHCAVNFFFNSA